MASSRRREGRSGTKQKRRPARFADVATRREFVRTVGAVLPAASLGTPAPAEPERLAGALVLSGGGSRGAYEAGIITALVELGGIADGQPLPGIDAVVGTSIGSLNGWFVATAQYGLLARLWQTIASANVFRLKRRYQPIVDPWSGVVTRALKAIALERGIFTNLQGIFDRGVVARWIAATVSPDTSPVVPFAFTVTNLSAQHAEVFYGVPQAATSIQEARMTAAVNNFIGRNAAAHRASGKLLLDALVAATAIPVIFDPVELTIDGVTSQYVDGGIADNTPVDIARILARSVYTILVDPDTSPPGHYTNILQIVFASFGVAQRRILDAALRTASLETESKRLFRASAAGAQTTFLQQVYDADLLIIQPETELPVAFQDFSSQANIDAAYQRGIADGKAGWKPYARPAPVAPGAI